MKRSGIMLAVALAAMLVSPGVALAQPAAPANARDGSHDFDFLIGDWKVHLKRLPDRLVGSTRWVDYDGYSNHHKLLASNANLEDFAVEGLAGAIKGQTLRLYNPATHEWSIYLVNLAAGTLDLPPVVGHFTGDRGEFFDHETWNGRPIEVRYVWLNLSPHAARMEQSFSADEGRTWEVNWIDIMSR
jgi:hypothetical protein